MSERKGKEKESLVLPEISLDGMSDETLDEGISKITIDEKTKKELAQACCECGKTMAELAATGEQLQSDKSGKLYCPTHLKEKVKKMLEKPPSKSKKDEAKSEASKTQKAPRKVKLPSLTSRVKDRTDEITQSSTATSNMKKSVQSASQRYVDPALLEPQSKEKLDEAVEGDISDLLKSFRGDLVESMNDAEKDLHGYLSGKELSTLKRAQDLPPLCNFLYTVYHFLKQQIHLEHQIATSHKVNLDTDKSILRDRFYGRFFKLMKFNIYVRHSELLEYYLCNAIIVACDLEFMIKENGLYWDRRSERWIAVILGLLGEFQQRNNTFFEQYELISNSRIEIQKLFSGFVTNLSKLASIERRLTKDKTALYDKAYLELPEDIRIERTIKHFETRLIPFMEPESKIKFFKSLLDDADVRINAESMIVLFSRENPETRKQFIKQLRPSLIPDEIDTLVPELAKYRGRVYGDSSTT
jgi:hypothetical protein